MNNANKAAFVQLPPTEAFAAIFIIFRLNSLNTYEGTQIATSRIKLIDKQRSSVVMLAYDLV
jgi:hypothetical protein